MRIPGVGPDLGHHNLPCSRSHRCDRCPDCRISSMIERNVRGSGVERTARPMGWPYLPWVEHRLLGCTKRRRVDHVSRLNAMTAGHLPEPERRIELLTYALRVRCSAV